ncbi:MAG TPA: adenylate cyclase regulatory domain-containing protein [Solirubrobacteraceae bacterium]|jgi:adenylate cyclase
MAEPAPIPEEWLAGLASAAREERLALLRRLLAQGFSIDELERAIAEDRLVLLGIERVFGAVLSAEEIERRTGVPAARLSRARRLLGLPEPEPGERVFTEEDVAAAEAIKLFTDAGIDQDAIDETTAVLGEGMARLAATIDAQFLQTFLRAGESEQEAAERLALIAQELTPAFRPVLMSAFTAQLRASVARGVLGSEQLSSGQPPAEQVVAVCFVDMVGFTRLGVELEVLELGAIARQLARLAATVVSPPARLIKTIGDAAMFVSPDPAALVEVALDLLDGAAAEDLPVLRAGIAYGPSVERAGDFYGNTVNLASRVTGVARPGSVLCTAEVHDAAAETFDWSFAGRHRLKGVSRPAPLHRARRAVTSRP